MSTNNTNITAVALAVKEAAEAQLYAAAGSAGGHVGGAGLGNLQPVGNSNTGLNGYPSPPSSLPNPGPLSNASPNIDGVQHLRKNGAALLNGSAIADGHAPEHQQVQLLEAASILVSMNPTPPDSSSGASNNEGNSSGHDSSSSEEATPPPGAGLASPVPTPRGIRNGAGKPGKRYSSSAVYSRSYNGNAAGFLAGSAPTGTTFPNHLPQRPLPRPRAGSTVSGGIRSAVGASPALRPIGSNEEDALAAAVELLSCSFHTPKIGPTTQPGSVPRGGFGLSDIGSPPAGGRNYVGPLNDVVEMKKEEDDDVQMEDDERWRRSEEEEDGVFGRMEE